MLLPEPTIADNIRADNLVWFCMCVVRGVDAVLPVSVISFDFISVNGKMWMSLLCACSLLVPAWPYSPSSFSIPVNALHAAHRHISRQPGLLMQQPQQPTSQEQRRQQQ